MTSNEQASKAYHKSQPNTAFAGSLRLMAALSSLRLHLDLREGGVYSGFSIMLPKIWDGLQLQRMKCGPVQGATYISNKCPLPAIQSRIEFSPSPFL